MRFAHLARIVYTIPPISGIVYTLYTLYIPQIGGIAYTPLPAANISKTIRRMPMKFLQVDSNVELIAIIRVLYRQ